MREWRGGWAPPGLNRFKEYSAIRKEENDYISCVLQSKDGKNGTYLKKKSESWSDSKNDSKGEVADQCTSKLSLQKKKNARVDWTYYFWRMKSMVHSSDWLCFFSVNLNLSMYIKKKHYYPITSGGIPWISLKVHVYMLRKANPSWDISRYTIQKQCITSIYTTHHLLVRYTALMQFDEIVV